MRKTGAILFGLLIVAAGLFVAPRAEASPEDFGIRNFEELDRADLRAKHVEVIAQLMLFSEKEAQAFWPVFRDYEGDLMKLSDKMIQISKDYVQHYETMTEEMANELAERFLDWQAGRVKLMRHYYKKFSKALSPKVAAKFFQLENQLWILMDLKIASTLPLLK